MFDRKVVRRRRAALAVFVALSDRHAHRLLRRVRRRLLPHAPARAPRRRSPRSRPAPAGRSSRSATSSAGSATRSTPRARTRSSKAEVERLRTQLAEVADRAARRRAAARARRAAASEDGFPQATEPVTARVIARSPTVWYSSVKIDKGSERRRAREPAGDRRRRPGRQGHAASPAAPPRCALITDGVERRVGAGDARAAPTGVVRPEVGEPDDLLLGLRRERPPRDRGHARCHVRLHVRARASSRCSRAASRSAG